MLELSRTVRFCLNVGAGDAGGAAGSPVNGFSAWPAMRGLGRFYQLIVRCRGEADPLTGYFINIKHIDAAVRRHVLPYLAQVAAGDGSCGAGVAMGEIMRQIVGRLQPPLNGSVAEARLVLSPFHSLAMTSNDMNTVIVRQQYEFSAAHRLHVEALSEQQNREVFGKCNNPAGHGHNYVVEVAVRAPVDPAGHTLAVDALDRLVDDAVIQPLDHKHLNLDVPQFRTLNPSVENIAVVVHGLLAGRVGELGVALEEVSVWETGKTVCTYRG
jgi:6-pyruvoyltetrahydropterin/6-carboxytetrahydropterin synthase